MLKFKFLKFTIVFLGIIAVYFFFFKEKFGEYNLKKSISACVVAQKKTLKSFNLEESKKYCEKQVSKQKEDN